MPSAPKDWIRLRCKTSQNYTYLRQALSYLHSFLWFKQQWTNNLGGKQSAALPEMTPRPLNFQDFITRSDGSPEADLTQCGTMKTPTEITNRNRQHKLYKDTHNISDMQTCINWPSKLGASSWRRLGNAKPSISKHKLTTVSVELLQKLTTDRFPTHK